MWTCNQSFPRAAPCEMKWQTTRVRCLSSIIFAARRSKGALKATSGQLLCACTCRYLNTEVNRESVGGPGPVPTEASHVLARARTDMNT